MKLELPATGLPRATAPVSLAPAPEDEGGEVESEFLPLPTFYVASASPSEGPLQGGTRVTLRGNRFTEPVRVFFGDEEAVDVIFLDETELRCDTPPHAPGLVDIEVERGDGLRTTLKGGFRYLGALQVSGAWPPVVPQQGGVPVVIQGQGFAPGAVVLVGSRQSPRVTFESSSLLHAVVPDGLVGPADVMVSQGGHFARLRDAIVYAAAPSVQLAVPPVSKAGELAHVHLVGKGLGAVDTVMVGGQDAMVVDRWGDDTLAIQIPPSAAAGLVDIAVSSPAGGFVLAKGFGWLPAERTQPIVWGPWPAVLPPEGGQFALAVVGEPMLAASAKVDAAPLGLTLSQTDVSLGLIWVDASPGSVGEYPLVVQGIGGLSGQTPKPILTLAPNALTLGKVTPAVLTPNGGALTLEGTGLDTVTEVVVGGLYLAPAQSAQSSTASVWVPPSVSRVADVHVRAGQMRASLQGAVRFEGYPLRLFGFTPEGGSIAGGSFVRLLGQGFVPGAEVLVGGQPASQVIVHNENLATAFAPPGAVGAAEVVVRVAGADAALVTPFQYIDPTVSTGGAFGEAVDESINIAVLEAGTGRPVPSAFVMLRARADSPFQGIADSNGLITFGGPGLRGPQTVTAARAGYVSHSVVGVDANYLALLLAPYVPPPPPGPPAPTPPPADPGRIRGRVLGLDKSALPPLGDCDAWLSSSVASPPAGVCVACSESTCSSGLNCRPLANQGPRCLAPCDANLSCASGFFCSSALGQGPHCVPAPGPSFVRCETSTSGQGTSNPNPGPGADVVAGPGGIWSYDIVTRPGEVAVRCEAGVTDVSTGNKRPLRWGFARHVMVAPGALVDGVDVSLDFQLTSTLRLLPRDAPIHPTGPNLISLSTWLELGSDGFVATGTPTGLNPNAIYEVPYLPQALVGDLYDASYVLRGGSSTQVPGGLPYSYVQRSGIRRTGTTGLFLRNPSGVWTRTEVPSFNDLAAVHGAEHGLVWAVGANGTVVAHNGGVWSQQPKPVAADLLAVFAAAPNHALAVGRQGAAAFFNGNLWQAEPTGTDRDLRAVHGSEEHSVVAGWFEVLSRTNGQWAPLGGAPLRDWHAVWAPHPGAICLAGAHGLAAHWNGQSWVERSVPIEGTIRALWGAGPNYLVAAGDGRDLAWFDGVQWHVLQGPESGHRFRSLWGQVMPQGIELWVTDEDGQLHELRQGAWTSQQVHPEAGVLAGVFSRGGEGQAPVYAVGSATLLLDPFMRIVRMGTPPDVSRPLLPRTVDYAVDEGVPPHFRYTVLSDASGLPLWTILSAGDLDRFDLPDLDTITGLPGFNRDSQGGAKSLLVVSAERPGFEMERFSYLDLRTSVWRAWSYSLLELPP